MAWPTVPLSRSIPSSSTTAHSAPSPPSMDMKMYEMMEHLRTVQIVQAEQSRRLDDQAFRLSQLEMNQGGRFGNGDGRSQAALQGGLGRLESQRYLWGPGAIGSASGTPGGGAKMGLGMDMGMERTRGGGLPGLGFEVFSSSPSMVSKEKNEKRQRDMDIQLAPDELHDLHGLTCVNGNGTLITTHCIPCNHTDIR